MIRVGLFGFGRAEKPLLRYCCREEGVYLSWVIRRSHILEIVQSRSLWAFKLLSRLYFPKDEMTPEQLFSEHPVDVVNRLFSLIAILAYGGEAAKGK